MSIKKKPEAEVFIEYVAQLHRAVHALGLFIDAKVGPDLNQPEALVLLQLLAAGPSTINDVHRAFLHRRSTLTSVLDRLESKNYIRRERSEADRRSIAVTLTKDGRKIAVSLRSALTELSAKLGERIDKETIALLESTASAASDLF